MSLRNKHKQHSKVRGASSRQPQPSRRINWQRLLPLLLVLVVALLLAAVYQGGLVLLSQPVTRVVVNGEYRYVEKQAIIDEVAPFLESGFVLLDLATMRQQLIRQPWVFDVAITRHWPDEIAISVQEQTPIARWGKRGFLNHRGELFTPRKAVAVADLPRLSGPDNEAVRVMNHFRELNVTLAGENLQLEKLALNKRGSWSARLGNGIQIEFGHGEVMEKMRRLLFAYELGLSAEFDRIKRIDMRYNNGFAVDWQQQKS